MLEIVVDLVNLLGHVSFGRMVILMQFRTVHHHSSIFTWDL